MFASATGALSEHPERGSMPQAFARLMSRPSDGSVVTGQLRS